MAHWTDLDTPHGPVRAWRADPTGPSHSAVIVLQEIFGANAHIRSVAERFAAAGFVALAPSLYDPVAPGVELAYTEADTQRGAALRTELGFDRAIDIVASAAAALHNEGLLVGVVGFCWGGSVSFLANTRLGLPAVSYYGARTRAVPRRSAARTDDVPLRRARRQHPAEVVEQHRSKQPTARVHVYPGANHAFNRDVDNHVHDPASAEQAWRRTLDFLGENLR